MSAGSGTCTRFMRPPLLTVSSLKRELKQRLQVGGARKEIERNCALQPVAGPRPGGDLARDLIGTAANVHDALRPSFGYGLDDTGRGSLPRRIEKRHFGAAGTAQAADERGIDAPGVESRV